MTKYVEHQSSLFGQSPLLNGILFFCYYVDLKVIQVLKPCGLLLCNAGQDGRGTWGFWSLNWISPVGNSCVQSLCPILIAYEPSCWFKYVFVAWSLCWAKHCAVLLVVWYCDCIEQICCGPSFESGCGVGEPWTLWRGCIWLWGSAFSTTKWSSCLEQPWKCAGLFHCFH